MSAPPADMVNGLIASVSGVAIGITALVTAVMKWIASRDNSPRIAVLESQVEKFDDTIAGVAGQIQNNAPIISNLVSTFPQVQKDLEASKTQIAALTKELTEAQQKITQLQALVPEGTTIQAKALFHPQQ